MANLTKSVEKIAALLDTYQNKPGSYRVTIHVLLTDGEARLEHAVELLPASRRSRGVATRKF